MKTNRTIAPERAERLNLDEQLAAKTREIAALHYSLAEAKKEIARLKAESPTGFGPVDRGMPRSPIETTRPGLVRMAKAMKLSS